MPSESSRKLYNICRFFLAKLANTSLLDLTIVICFTEIKYWGKKIIPKTQFLHLFMGMVNFTKMLGSLYIIDPFWGLGNFFKILGPLNLLQFSELPRKVKFVGDTHESQCSPPIQWLMEGRVGHPLSIFNQLFIQPEWSQIS